MSSPSLTLPTIYQRLEAAVLLGASIYFYHYFHFNFLWFALLLFSFDIFMLGYLVGKNIGAHMYNVGHSLILPVSLLVIAAIADNRILAGLGLIWLAHIGLDRASGYGLKLASGFKDTHLGQIGKT